MSTWDLMILFYELGDGTTWSAQDKRAAFSSQESAKAFKDAAPDWTVLFRT